MSGSGKWRAVEVSERAEEPDTAAQSGEERPTCAASAEAHWEIGLLIGPCDQDDAEWLAERVFHEAQGRLGAVLSLERIDDIEKWLTPTQEIAAALERVTAERDRWKRDYLHGTQPLIDATCHYRNLAISLGAKPDAMRNQYDRDLATNHTEDDEGGWDTELPDVWDELAAAEADRDRLEVEARRAKELLGRADETFQRTVATVSEHVGHIARGCRSGSAHNPAVHESAIEAALADLGWLLAESASEEASR